MKTRVTNYVDVRDWISDQVTLLLNIDVKQILK